MSKLPSVYDLYGPTSLTNLERSIGAGSIPTAAELAAILEANADQPLPAWFLAVIAKSLRRDLKQKRGRPKDSILTDMRWAIAIGKYHRTRAWLQKRPASTGWNGWSAVRGKDWWTGPPHERAARILTARWLKHITWETFRNRVSS